MFKSTRVRVAVKLLLILLAISIYFYFQHPVRYRCTNLNLVLPIADMKLVIEDISITNLDENKRHFPMSKDDIPWVYRKIIYQNNLPMELRLNLLKIASFYTRPPLTKENAYLNLTGTLIYPAEIRNPEKSDGLETLDQFNIDISPGYFSGRGCNAMNGDNYCRWHTHGTFDLSDLKEKFTLAITDKASNNVSYIYFTPRWEKERLMQNRFNRDIFEGPSWPVKRYIEQASQDNTEAAPTYIIPAERNYFKAPDLNSNFKDADIRCTVDWESSLSEYAGAYRVVAEAGKYQNEEQTDFVPTTEHKYIFYTVKDPDGKFYIVLAQ
jgi:hypothetical protein